VVADSTSVAAPGDCAQPVYDLDSGPVLPSVSSGGGVAGPPPFAPLSTTRDVLAQLPLDLTGVTLLVAPVSSTSTSLLDSIGQTLGLVDTTSTTLGTAGDAVQDVGDAVVDTTGAVSTTSTTLLNTATSAGTAVLNTTTGTTSGSLAAGAGDSGTALINSTTDTSTTLINTTTDTSTSLLNDSGSLIQNTTGPVTGTVGGLLK
jgi:hypothetical protein